MLFDESGAVRGIATGDMGIAREGSRKPSSRAAWSCAASTRFSPKGRAASLTKELIKRFDLAEGRDPQKFGIGLKELWQVSAGEITSPASSSIRSAGPSTT